MKTEKERKKAKREFMPSLIRSVHPSRTPSQHGPFRPSPFLTLTFHPSPSARPILLSPATPRSFTLSPFLHHPFNPFLTPRSPPRGFTLSPFRARPGDQQPVTPASHPSCLYGLTSHPSLLLVEEPKGSSPF